MRSNYKKTFFKENYNFHHFKGKCTNFPAQRKLFCSCAQVHHPENTQNNKHKNSPAKGHKY